VDNNSVKTNANCYLYLKHTVFSPLSKIYKTVNYLSKLRLNFFRLSDVNSENMVFYLSDVMKEYLMNYSTLLNNLMIGK
jgi:hypothetical protein